MASAAVMNPAPAAAAAPAVVGAGGAAMMPTPMASASLYVGDLHSDVTEPMLFEIFHQVGPVASIRVCRDAVTRRSLGYAYVNYHNMVDAERALDTLNYTAIKNTPCRIMWKHRDPSIRKTGVGNVFIKGLEKDIDNRVLNDTFSQFGNIISCKVAVDANNKSKGHGYVQYETKEEADTAIEKVNGKLVNGKKVTVCSFMPRQDREKITNPGLTFTNVYINNLNESVDETALTDLFKKFGKITSVVVMRDENSKSKGFGFVNMDTHEAAVKAVEELSGQEVAGKKVMCCRAEKKDKREAENKRKFQQRRAEQQAKYQGVNLYVKNLDDNVDDEKLRSTFAVYGTIQSAKVMTDDNKNSKGFGFVCFSSPDDATRAITAMNGQMFGTKPIYVALHQTKEVRKAQLQMQAQFAQRQGHLAAGGMQRMPQIPGMPMHGVVPPVFYHQPPPGPNQRQFMFPMQPAVPNRGGWVQPRVPQQPRYRRQQPGQQPGQQQGQVPAAGGVAPANANGRGQQQIKYTSNVRNQSVPQPNAAAPDAAAAPSETITSTSLANAPPEQQKQILGERLYALISVSQPQHAPKITGMLLELDNAELINLIESPNELQAKVAEALAALNSA